MKRAATSFPPTVLLRALPGMAARAWNNAVQGARAVVGALDAADALGVLDEALNFAPALQKTFLRRPAEP